MQPGHNHPSPVIFRGRIALCRRPLFKLLDVVLEEMRQGYPPVPLSGGVRKAQARSIKMAEYEVRRLYGEFSRIPETPEFIWTTCLWCHEAAELPVGIEIADCRCENCGRRFSASEEFEELPGRPLVLRRRRAGKTAIVIYNGHEIGRMTCAADGLWWWRLFPDRRHGVADGLDGAMQAVSTHFRAMPNLPKWLLRPPSPA